MINRLPKRERPLLTINNGLAEATVLPYLGGRILRLRTLPDGRNVFFEPADDLTIDHVAKSYLDYGGYEEYLGAAFAGPGWELPFEPSHDSESIRLYAAHGSMISSREVTMLSERPGISLSTGIKNSGPDPARGHPAWTSFDDFGRAARPFGSGLEGRRRDNGARPSVRGVPGPVSGSWAVYDPIGQRGVIHRFDETKAAASLHLDFDKNSFNLEIKTTATELTPGEYSGIFSGVGSLPRRNLRANPITL